MTAVITADEPQGMLTQKYGEDITKIKRRRLIQTFIHDDLYSVQISTLCSAALQYKLARSET